MSIKSYRDLEVWQRAMELAEQVYQLTTRLPTDERFGLISQLRRCAVSVPSNIAEGFGRRATKEFIQFLYVARGSTMELETQITLAVRLGLLPREEAAGVWQLAEQVAQMLSKFISSLKKREQAKPARSRTTNHEPRTTTR